ncbi:MAG: putative deacylase [Gammaproteobacteria bacterium]|jgi:predicted deacylase
MTKIQPLKAKKAVRVQYSFVQLMAGSDLSIRRLPLMSAVSANAGPVVWLTACIHGDEIVGIAIIQEVFKYVRRRLMRGSVYAFPVANPIGLETNSRNITLSGEDLNRCFPGSVTGTLGQRVAERIFQTIMSTSPELVVDMHSDWKQSIPYTIIDQKPSQTTARVYERVIDTAHQSGFACIEDDSELHRSLSYNLLQLNVPAITLEIGEPYVINEENVTYGLNAVLNILSDLDMIATDRAAFCFPLPDGYGPESKLKYSDKPFSSKSGIIRFKAVPGTAVKRGDQLAQIVNVYGKLQEKIKAIDDGIVLGHTDSSVVFPGMPIMAFGIKA